MRWRPIVQKPHTAEPITALIATRSEEGDLYLLGIYEWRRGAWVSEETFKPLPEDGGEHWWMPEEELLAEIPEHA